MAIWIPPEDKDPTVLQYPTRKGISVFGAVNIRTGEFIGMISGRFNPIIFKKFLMVLIKRGNGKKMQINLDNTKKQKGSKNMNKARIKVTTLQEHIANQRMNLQHSMAILQSASV